MMPGVRRLLVTTLIALPVFLLLSWWNAAVGVLFGVAVLTWILAGVYFRSTGWFGESDDRESRRDARHREFFE
jgi:hypothetical protein